MSINFRINATFTVCPQDYPNRAAMLSALGKAIDNLDQRYGGVINQVSTSYKPYGKKDTAKEMLCALEFHVVCEGVINE